MGSPVISDKAVSSSGFVDMVRDSGSNFCKIDGVHKLATLFLTVVTAVFTLGIGGFFIFVACSDYFASKTVVDMAKEKKSLLLQRIEESFKETLTPRESRTMSAEEIEQMADRLYNLDDQVDGLNMQSGEVFGVLCKIRADLTQERITLREIGASGSELVEPMMNSVEGKLAAAELLIVTKNETLQLQAASFARQRQELAPLGEKIESLTFEDITSLGIATDLLGDIQKRVITIDEILGLHEIEATLKTELGVIKLELKDLESRFKKRAEGHTEQIYAVINAGFDNANLINQGSLATSTLRMSGFFPSGLYSNLFEKSQELLAANAPKGIKNIGNSCYINATVQALIGNEAIKEKIMNPVWPGLQNELQAIKIQERRKVADNPLLLNELDNLFIAWEESENIHDYANEDYRESIKEIFDRVYIFKNLQCRVQEFIRQLDHSQKPTDMFNPAWHLRDAILATPGFAQQTEERAEDLISQAANSGKVLNPKKALAQAKLMQHDAGELMTLVLDLLDLKLTLETTTHVPAANFKDNVHQQPATTLIIPLEGQKDLHLQTLVDNIFATEEINDDENAYYTNGQYFPRFDRTQKLAGLPKDQIIVQLGRFNNQLRKINSAVILPEDHIIDFSKGYNAEEGSALYSVQGSVHHGGTREFGHYRALTSGVDDWYEVNDSKVSKLYDAEQELATSYFFIFQRII